jgi:bifunctional non-homologous end joining protein LigD
MVWDLGAYELLGGSVAEGSLKLELHGHKLKGEWHLFRIRSDEKKPVWLVVKSGRPAKAITPRQEDRSVLSGRTLAQIARDPERQWKGRRPATRGRPGPRSGAICR